MFGIIFKVWSLRWVFFYCFGTIYVCITCMYMLGCHMWDRKCLLFPEHMISITLLPNLKQIHQAILGIIVGKDRQSVTVAQDMSCQLYGIPWWDKKLRVGWAKHRGRSTAYRTARSRCILCNFQTRNTLAAVRCTLCNCYTFAVSFFMTNFAVEVHESFEQFKTFVAKCPLLTVIFLNTRYTVDRQEMP